jgi:Protein of unknown function (DUF3467)
MNDDRSGPRDAGPHGRYANWFEIGHNEFEFVLDFGQHYAGQAPATRRKVQRHTRIVTTPAYAKALLALLGDVVARYEQLFGAIPARAGGDDRPDVPDVT